MKETLAAKSIKKDSGCIEWTGARIAAGYGEMTFNNRPVRAHRAAYEVYKGPIPEGMFVCHTCDNRACINPEHLFIGTHTENMLDARKKGRTRRGNGHQRAVLTEDIVRNARAEHASGVPVRQIAIRLGVNPATLCAAVRGDTWIYL